MSGRSNAAAKLASCAQSVCSARLNTALVLPSSLVFLFVLLFFACWTQAGIKADSYASLAAFEADMRLMFRNARSYNEPGSLVHNDAQAMQVSSRSVPPVCCAPFRTRICSWIRHRYRSGHSVHELRATAGGGEQRCGPSPVCAPRHIARSAGCV